MRGVRSGVRRLLVGGLLASGVVVSGLLVTGSSYSVFSSTTNNPTDSWSAGTVALADDDSNTAMFTATGLKPGSTGTKCIAVTSSGTLASTVKLYGTSYSNPTTTANTALATNLNLVVTQGTGGGFASGCSGFTALPSGSAVYSGTMANFGSTVTAFSSGVPASGAWAPTGSGSETRVFQFQYTLDTNAPNTAQNGSVSIGFTWEAQNS